MKMEKGITLIALIITIILMLILAAVVINVTVGENGLFNTAKKAAIDYKISEILEKLEIEKANLIADMNGDIPSVAEYINYIIGKNIISEQDVTHIDDNTKQILVEKYMFLVEKEENGNIKITYNEMGTVPTPPTPPTLPEIGEIGTTHTAKQIPYSWDDLGKIAKVISDRYGNEEGQINENTVEVSVSYGGISTNLGIGDWTTVNGKKVRILGFNHDNLVTTTKSAEGEIIPWAQYGERTTNIKAGISFEFSEIITSARINKDYKKVVDVGWGGCPLRSTLNSTTINSLENKEYIKTVSKKYIQNCDKVNSVKQSEDRLWLLSCSEIWNNGIEGKPYGYAIASEGEQYIYYEKIDADANSSNVNIVKGGSTWYLRSYVRSTNPYYFCYVTSSGRM